MTSPPLLYYHFTIKPLVFKDRLKFNKKGYQPDGLYCTKFPNLFIYDMFYDICSFERIEKLKKCFLYSFIIKPSFFTTNPDIPQPDKILKVTKKNWLKVSHYMQIHSRQDLCRDFAGLDADDKALHVFLKEKAYTPDILSKSWNRGHSVSELVHIFPHGFSALKFDNLTYPEACIWRASSWIKPILIEPIDKKISKFSSWPIIIRNNYDFENTPYEVIDDPLDEYDRQNHLIYEWLDRTFRLANEDEIFMKASKLASWYRKEIKQPCTVEQLTRVYLWTVNEDNFKIEDGQTWLKGKLLRKVI